MPTLRCRPTTSLSALVFLAWLTLLPACGHATHEGEATGRHVAPSLAFDQTSRRWIGPELVACRLQDWRLDQGRVVCDETSARFPLRAAVWGDTRVADVPPGERAVSVRVRTGVLGAADGSPSGVADAPGWRGLLLGAGRPGDDPRVATLVHHRPARDGGVLAVVDGRGRPLVFDMGVDASVGGSWSVGGSLADGELPRLAGEDRGPVFGTPWYADDPEAPSPEPDALAGAATAEPPTPDESRAVALHVEAWREADGWRLEVLVLDDVSGVALGRTTVRGLPVDRVPGAPGLVSHGAPSLGGRFWFDDLSVEGPGVSLAPTDPSAVRFVQYTVSDDRLAVTAQFAPLGPDDDGTARLERLLDDGRRELLAEAPVDAHAWTATFGVDDWDAATEQRLVVTHGLADGSGRRPSSYPLRVAAAPRSGEPVRVASLNCTKHYTGGLQWNSDALWFPHADTAEGVRHAAPDLLVFTGDQLYEGDLDPVDARDEPTLVLDYLTKWFRFGASFGELTRRHPTITIPDDHDVYHGNLWGAGGRAAVSVPGSGLSAQDSGGYKHGPLFVNVVHRTQTSHLPPPVDPSPVEQGISVYFTELRWGGVSVAVVADRQWKSSASVVVPEGQVVNGWFGAEGFDPNDADVPGAELLGPRQEAFLARWAVDWSGGVWAKLVVSQTPFVNVATLPEKASGGSVLPSLPVPEPGDYPQGYRFAADTDSGGWPQTPRDRAVRSLSQGLAVHLAGDQHLGTLVEYGVDAHRDGGFVFTSPAIANTWPRRWWPPVWGSGRDEGAPHYTGDFEDGFGNKLTVWAAANPVKRGLQPAALHDRAPGFGLIDLDPGARTITFHCWPRGALPSDARGEGSGVSAAPSLLGGPPLTQYEGWPRTIHQLDNGPEAVGWLDVRVDGCDDPVLTVRDAAGEVLYVWRAPEGDARLPVPHAGPWSVQAWDEGRDRRWEQGGLRADGPAVTLGPAGD